METKDVMIDRKIKTVTSELDVALPVVWLMSRKDMINHNKIRMFPCTTVNGKKRRGIPKKAA